MQEKRSKPSIDELIKQLNEKRKKEMLNPAAAREAKKQAKREQRERKRQEEIERQKAAESHLQSYISND